jgi:hypothetical protein
MPGSQGVRLLHESVAAPVQQLSAVLPQLLQLLASAAAGYAGQQQGRRHRGAFAGGSAASKDGDLPLPVLADVHSSTVSADDEGQPIALPSSSAVAAAAGAATSAGAGLCPHHRQQPRLQQQQQQQSPEVHLSKAYNLAAVAGDLVVHLTQALSGVIVAGEEARHQRQQQPHGLGGELLAW